MNIQSAETMIKSLVSFDCPICLDVYDNKSHFPMMLCTSQHSCCEQCVQKIVFKIKDISECPFCKQKISKNKVKKFRLLNEICQTAKKIKKIPTQSLKKAQKDNNKFNPQLINQQSKTLSLIQQIIDRKETEQKRQSQTLKQIQMLQYNIGFLKSLLDSKQLSLYEQFAIKQQIQLQNSKKAVCFEDFVLIKELGEGQFGPVSIRRHKKLGFICVIKCYQKWKVQTLGLLNQVIKQIKVSCFLKAINLNKGYGYFSDNKNVYLMTQVSTDGNLLAFISKFKTKGIDKSKISIFIYQLCLGVKQLISLNIIHKQIAAQSILLSYNEIVKISGFNWLSFKNQQGLQQNNEYYYYDIRSLGFLTYHLLFPHINIKKIRANQLLKEVQKLLLNDDKDKIIYNFIKETLTRDTHPNIKINNLLNHPFVAKHKLYFQDNPQFNK